MTQSVELLLDAVTESAVHEEWVQLRAAGLPSELRSAADLDHRPHVTLYAAHSLPLGAESRLDALMAGLSLDLQLGALMLFGPHRDRYVLVHQVVPTLALLRLQQSVLQICGGEGDPHFATGRWSPHVTVARRVPAAALGAVLDTLTITTATGRSARVTRCRRWDGDAKRSWLLSA